MPVIKTGSLDMPVFNGKTQRPNQMKPGPGTQAGTADIAGIPVNFRGHKHHMSLYPVGLGLSVHQGRASIFVCYVSPHTDDRTVFYASGMDVQESARFCQTGKTELDLMPPIVYIKHESKKGIDTQRIDDMMQR